jgi:hypothetical protein
MMQFEEAAAKWGVASSVAALKSAGKSGRGCKRRDFDASGRRCGGEMMSKQRQQQRGRTTHLPHDASYSIDMFWTSIH